MTDAKAAQDRCLKFDRFEVIEWMCETPKGDPALNEDRLIINDRFIAVVDGATASGLINGVPGGNRRRQLCRGRHRQFASGCERA